ncbi:MFS transporter [Bremerella cremea]|uniref:MFS transporter n=1 Tax=Bremerella cremea TaxID=1031537 RepID=A0A368KXR4_9BACT|nr:nucleoside permease [Bremerella cremea]RCS54244.1 MFS transporter [Bremerella cremea]
MLNPKVISLSVMMFLQFFVWGSWYVSLGPYMSEREMFDMISWAYTVGPIAAIISPFFLGFIADRYFASERVLGALHFLGAIAMFIAPMAAEIDSVLFVFVLFIHMLCYMPTLGLTNTLAFSNIDDQEKQFPIIRVFGTIGWIIAGITVGTILHANTTDTQFYLTGIAGIALALYSFALPHTPPPSAGKTVTFREIIGADTLALMKERSFTVFIIGSFLICIPLSAYYAFASTFAGKVGFEDMTTVMAAGQGSEILFMLLMPLFFRRLGVKWMLFAGMAAWVLRYGLFSGADADNVKWMVFLGILLHGICYDFFFVTGFIYTDKKCGPELRGQAQGFLVFVTQGLGLGIGAQVMGAIAGYYTAEDGAKDWQMIWLMPCIMAGVVMILFGLLFNDKVEATEDETGYGTDEAPVSEPSH